MPSAPSAWTERESVDHTRAKATRVKAASACMAGLRALHLGLCLPGQQVTGQASKRY